MPPILLGLVCLFVSTLLSAALGFRILKWSGLVSAPSILVSLGLGLGAMQFIPFLLLTAGIGTAPILQGTISVVGLLLFPDMITISRGAWGQLCRQWKLLWWEWFLLAVLVVLLGLIFLRTVLPATDIDVLSYHLTAPLRFFAAGEFLHILTVTPTSWPMALELLYGTLITCVPNAPIGVIPFLFGVTTVVLVYLHALRIGNRLSAGIAFVLLMGQSTFWWEMSTGMIDIGTACFALLSLYVLAPGGNNRSSVVLSAVFAGLAATTKLQGLWVVPSMLVVHFLSEKNNGILLAFKLCFTFGLISFLTVLPWYIKTWIVTGNPLYPLFFDVFGGTELSDSGSSRYFELYRLIDAYHALPSSIPLNATTVSLYHFGRIGLAIGVTAVLLHYSRRHSNSMLIGFAAIFSTFICAASSFHMRFLLPAYAASCAGVSYIGRGWSTITGVGLCAVATFFAVWIAQTRLQPDLSLSWRGATGGIQHRDYLMMRLRTFSAIEFANGNLSEGSRILLGTVDENTALLRHESYWANLWLQDSFHYESIDRLLSDIRRMRVTHLMLVHKFPHWFENHVAWKVRVETEHPALKEVARRFGTELFSDTTVALYRLDIPADEDRQTE